MIPNTTFSDSELIAGLQQGDEKVQIALTERYRLNISYLLSKFTSDIDDLEDITRQAFHHVFKERPACQSTTDIKRMLYQEAVRIAAGIYIDQFKRLRKVEIDHYVLEADVVIETYKRRENGRVR